MSTEIPSEVIQAFSTYESYLPDHSAGDIKIENIGGGLINNSYKIICQFKPNFFLQKINKSVFTNPEVVQNNYFNLWQYSDLEFTDLHLPSPKNIGKDKTFFIDKNGEFWRAFNFIENTKMYKTAATPTQAKTTAKTFAKFTKAFDNFNVDKLQEVIPNFHNLSFRYQQFEEALSGELYERMAKASPIIQEIKSRIEYRNFFKEIVSSNKFLKRVMHHDAKIANVLFNNISGEVVCPVDFDTVMPGYFFSDLGDMIRSMAGNTDETNTDFENIEIRTEFYDAIIAGYVEEIGKQLNSAEKENIHFAGLIMIYMQALRFITDYLNGDKYYQISYAEQNFDRAKNQLTLLKCLEKFLEVQYKFKMH